MKVVDAKVLVYLLVQNDQTPWARRLFEQDGDWYAPSLWRFEVMNVLCTLTRRKVLDASQALEAWNLAVRLMLDRDIDPDPVQTMQLAMAHGISGHDAQYVSLAKEMNCELLTADAALRRAFPELVLV